MSKQISVVSVTERGDQLTASGFTNAIQVLRHIEERITSATRYVNFTVITTKVDSTQVPMIPETTVVSWTRAQVEAFPALAKELS